MVAELAEAPQAPAAGKGSLRCCWLAICRLKAVVNAVWEAVPASATA